MRYITLLSDFGLQDPSAAIAKGILLQTLSGINIFDITHEVAPFNKAQAAYLLACAYKNFPEGSCHIVLVDVFSGKEPALILVKQDNHYFLGPDNGIFPMAFRSNTLAAWRCDSYAGGQSLKTWLAKAASVISELDSDTGMPTMPTTVLPMALAARQSQTSEMLHADLIHIDGFGNAVLNVNRDQLAPFISTGKQFHLRFIQYEEIKDLSNNYGDVREGYKLCRFNNAGYLEIAVNKGNAAELFGLRIGSKHNGIQITFR